MIAQGTVVGVTPAYVQVSPSQPVYATAPMMRQDDLHGPDALAPFPNLFAKQTRKGCFQELLGCDANTEFKIATLEQRQADVFYALEDTSCCMRFVCSSNRPFTMNMSKGAGPGGEQILIFKRDLACPMGACKCCCFQNLEIQDPKGESLGYIREPFWFCIPTLTVLQPDGNLQYNVHPPTCMGGVCIDCCAEGCCSCRVPFYFFPPGATENQQHDGSIVKIWSGLTNELFTDADKFEVTFPANADAKTKARLMGAVFLINQVFFERDNKNH